MKLMAIFVFAELLFKGDNFTEGICVGKKIRDRERERELNVDLEFDIYAQISVKLVYLFPPQVCAVWFLLEWSWSWCSFKITGQIFAFYRYQGR